VSVARELAKSANSLIFEDLPSDVIHQTERLVLDTLGCAIGGYASEASRVIQKVVKEFGHPEEATVFRQWPKNILPECCTS